MLHNDIRSEKSTSPSAPQFPFPTLEECAFFAKDAYNFEDYENKLPENALPAGWSVYGERWNEQQGYFGKAYIKNWGTSNAMLVFAHRGTIPIFADIIEDLKYAMDWTGPQAYTAFGNLLSIANKLNIGNWLPDPNAPNPDTAHYKQIIYLDKCSITHVGHSLGAIIADVCASRSIFLTWELNDYLKNVRSITFENPGARRESYDILKIEINNNPWIGDLPTCFNLATIIANAYQAGVNLINTFKEQLGQVHRLTPLTYDFSTLTGMLPFPPTSHYSSNPFYIAHNTFDQHSINKIENLLKSGGGFYAINNPVDLQPGYVEYLNPENVKYWQSYFEYMWKTDPVLRALWQDKKNDFFIHAGLELKGVYETAAKNLSKEQSSIISVSMFKQQKTAEQIVQEFHLIENDANPTIV